MQISDEMVEKAARRMAVADGKNPDKLSHNSFEWWRHYVPMARAVLEPALSAAEPVAWQPRYKQEVIDHHKSIGSDLCEYAMTVYPTKEQAQGYGYGGYECRALYAEPQPAPSVAVKALEWSDEDNGDFIAQSIVGWHHIGLPHLTWNLMTPNGDVQSFNTLKEAKAAAQADYEARVSSALSAQVQDVAGDEEWQTVPKHPTGKMIDAVVSMVDGDAPHPFILNLYRAMLAVAPAKQEGGE